MEFLLQVFNVIFGIAVLYFGGKLIGVGEFDLGQMTGFLTYIGQTLTSLMMLSMVFIMLTMSRAPMKRAYELLLEEPELQEFVAFAESAGKHITGAVRADFLCNKHFAEKKLPGLIPEGTKAVFVISCGLGIQTIADIVELPVFAACDSIHYTGHHGMALTKKACDACAQCYLNITGGICPVVDCSKSLLNGQCGGAKNGKCEVDPDMECGWERIMRRLAQVGRLDAIKCPVQVRNYATDDKVSK